MCMSGGIYIDKEGETEKRRDERGRRRGIEWERNRERERERETLLILYLLHIPVICPAALPQRGV